MALAALAHPTALAAILLLLFNDHLFKGAGPGWLTGKLSDFAGLYFFPFLLALVLSPAMPDIRRIKVVAFGVTAGVFTAMKLTPHAAEIIESLATTATGLPSSIVVDPTDLIALPVLVLGSTLWNSVEERPPDARRVMGVLLAVVAGLATMATTSVDPPSVGFVWSHEDEVFALVEDPDQSDEDQNGVLFRRTEPAVWEEVADSSLGNRALASAPVTSWHWTYLQEAVNYRARCDQVQPSRCASGDRVPFLERSNSGGLGWEPYAAPSPPGLYSAPDTEPFLALRGPVCDPNSPLEPDSRVCTRQIAPPRPIFGWQWEVSKGRSGVWNTMPPPPDAALADITGRCALADPMICYRATDDSGWWVNHVSDNGGITWRPADVAEDDLSFDDEIELISDPVCQTSEMCFRLVDASDRIPWVEESTDGGLTWTGSWRPSPLSGSMAPSAVAVTSDSVVVGLGYRGVVTRDAMGAWQHEGIGPVPQFDPPGPLEPGPTWIPALVWFYMVTTLVFGLLAILIRGLSRKERVSVASLAVGGAAYAGVMVSLASISPPFGLWDYHEVMGRLLNIVVLAVLPITAALAIAVVDWRHERMMVLARATGAAALGIAVAVIVLVVGFGY